MQTPLGDRRCSLTIYLAGALALSATARAPADHGAFNYDPIEDEILSATFSADFAALVAHPSVFGETLNMAMLLDLATGLTDFDMSDDLFGTAEWPETPQINMGDTETGIVSAEIDPSFFAALESGDVGLWFLATDTDDALFAIDFLSLTIVTASETFESFYGWPIGNENNGFGLGIPDGGNLPGPMPGVLAPTGTGFDEEISSKSIHIPEPTTLALLAVGMACCRRRRRRCDSPSLFVKQNDSSNQGAVT